MLSPRPQECIILSTRDRNWETDEYYCIVKTGISGYFSLFLCLYCISKGNIMPESKKKKSSHIRIIIQQCCLQVDKWKRQTTSFWRGLDSRFLKGHLGPQCTWELVRTPLKDSFSRLMSVLRPYIISFDRLPALNLHWVLDKPESSKNTSYRSSCMHFSHHVMTTAMLYIVRAERIIKLIISLLQNGKRSHK